MSRIYCLFMVSFLILFGCSIGGTTTSGKELTLKKCEQCHSHMITCSKLDKGKDYWEATVHRMAKKDMDLSKEQESSIVDYLNDLSPGSEPICN